MGLFVSPTQFSEFTTLRDHTSIISNVPADSRPPLLPGPADGTLCSPLARGQSHPLRSEPCLSQPEGWLREGEERRGEMVLPGHMGAAVISCC